MGQPLHTEKKKSQRSIKKERTKKRKKRKGQRQTHPPRRRQWGRQRIDLPDIMVSRQVGSGCAFWAALVSPTSVPFHSATCSKRRSHHRDKLGVCVVCKVGPQMPCKATMTRPCEPTFCASFDG